MSRAPLVSILMPAYHAELYIAEAIRSILEQQHENWELLILDDASQDGTLKMARSFIDTRIRVLQNHENKGYLHACNRLFEEASGDFITFLDADDTCPKNRLPECLHVFECNKEVDFLTTDHVRIGPSGEVLSEHTTPIDYGRYASDPSYYPTICCATIFLRKELFDTVGGYHPFFTDIGGEDYHWLFRLSRDGTGVHLRQPLYHYRQHAAQTHATTPDPLHHFVADMDRELRAAIISGTDPLQHPEQLRSKWEQYVDQHPEELYHRQAAEALNRRTYRRFFNKLVKQVFTAPFSMDNLKQAARMTYAFLTRIA